MATFLRSAIIFPFTAGRPKQEENGTISHDGGISGVILLLGIVVTVTEVLFAGTTPKAVQFESVDVLMTVSGTWVVLATVTCLVITLYYLKNNNVVIDKGPLDACSQIKLRFLWGFTISCVTFDILYLSVYADCFHRVSSDRITEHIILLVLFTIFSIVQTGFLTYFSQFNFQSIVGIYYALLLFCMGNICRFLYAFVQIYRSVDEGQYNITTNGHQQNITTRCDDASPISSVVNKIRPFLEPTICEQSLLSFLFLIEIWPVQSADKSNNFKDFEINDQVNECSEEASLISAHGERTYMTIQNEEPSDNFHDVDEQGNCGRMRHHRNRHIYQTNQQTQTQTRSTYRNSSDRSRIYISISIPILISLPDIVMYCVRIGNNHDKSLLTANNIYNCVDLTIAFLFVLRCFYHLQTHCRPVFVTHKLSGCDIVLILSYLVALAYYTLRLISNAFLVTFGNVRFYAIYSNALCIVCTYYQTVFLLQVKNFGKKQETSSIFSIEYTCIFLCTENLITWGIDTFISSQYIFQNDAAYRFYGHAAWVEFYTFLFPFVIFYRFNCFVLFYGLYFKFRS